MRDRLGHRTLEDSAPGMILHTIGEDFPDGSAWAAMAYPGHNPVRFEYTVSYGWRAVS